MNIDIIRTSASRPDLLKISTQSFIDHLKFSGNINWYIHEDVINVAASDECVNYSKSLGIYKEIGVDRPALGHNRSFNWLTDRVTSPYFMFVEDDYELLQVYECTNPDCVKKTANKYKDTNLETCKHCGSKFVESPTNLDVLIDIMERNKNINEICFPKRDILPDKPNFTKRTVQFDNTLLTICHHWYVSPAIWRTSFIMPYLKKLIYPPGSGCWGWHWDINRALKGGDGKIIDANWVEKNTGHYYLGEIRSGQRIQHLGQGDKSLREGNYKWN